MHLFCKFGGVGGCWLAEKWLEPQNTPESMVLAPLNPPPKEVSAFVLIKVRSSQTFLCRKLFPLCLVWAVWLFEWTQLVFLGYVKTFFPENDITVMLQVGATYLRMCSAVLWIQWYLQWPSSSIHSEVMVAQKFAGHFVAAAGV